MLTLLIVRHAEAVHNNGPDIDRILTPEGQKQALNLATQCKLTGDKIDCLVHSAALRASQTSAILADELNITHLLKEESLYKGDVQTYMHIVTQLDNAFATVMLVGHNPAVSDLVNYLTGEQVHGMPTASCAIVVCPHTHWSMVNKDTCMWRQLLLA